MGESLINYNSMQNCKNPLFLWSMSVTSLTISCIGLHYNVMMMSVLQEVKGLTKKLYSIILPVERQVSMQNFRLNVYTLFFFLHYNVLSGPIIIVFSRSKGVNGKNYMPMH